MVHRFLCTPLRNPTNMIESLYLHNNIKMQLREKWNHNKTKKFLVRYSFLIVGHRNLSTQNKNMKSGWKESLIKKQE